MGVWNRSNHRSWHLSGHSHPRPPRIADFTLSIEFNRAARGLDHYRIHGKEFSPRSEVSASRLEDISDFHKRPGVTAFR